MKVKTDRKKIFVIVRLTEKEKENLDLMVKFNHVSISNYVRDLLNIDYKKLNID